MNRASACGAMRRRGSLPAREAEAQELAHARLGHRALGLVDLELETLGQEPLDARHHPLARPLTAHIDVAVVGVAHEAMAALLQFLVQHVQHQVRQQRRERPALRRAFLRRADQPVRQHARSQKAADQLQDALVSHPLGHQPHQDVVVDPVEELLQVDIHHDAVPGRDVRLRPRHRLMRRAPRPEAVAASENVGSQSACSTCSTACWMKRSSTVGMPSGRSAARRLRYLDPPHRLRLVGAVKQLSPDRGPVLLQVGRQLVDGHPVDARRALVAPDLRQRLPSCHARQSLPSTAQRPPGFRARLSPRALRSLRRRRFGASPFAPVPKVSSSWIFCRMARTRSPLYLPFHRSGLRRIAAAYYALC